MPNLTFSDGRTVQVSSEIYISEHYDSHTNRINELTNQQLNNTIALWRQIGGCWDNPEIGWHPKKSEGWSCYIALALCYNGIDRDKEKNRWCVYYGLHDSRVRKLNNVHPLNMGVG